jgi:signal transduction histidine kinase
MALNPEDEARGMKAYEQARAFERLRTWRLQLTFIVFALIPALCGAWMWATGYSLLAWLNFFAAVLLSWMGRFQWKQLVARHGRNLRLLAELKAEHGAALPWVQVENHFAELEKIKRELGPADGSSSKRRQ